MRQLASSILAITIAVHLLLGCDATPRIDDSWIDYPEAPRSEQADTYYKREVLDPYRWLEDEPSPRVQAWLSAQDEITERFFAELGAHREFTDYLTEHWYDGALGVPVRRHERTFTWRAREGASHPVLYRTEGDRESVVFDLNCCDPDGRRSTLPASVISRSGRYSTYSIAYDGADAAEIHIYDNQAERELDEFLPVAFSFVTGFAPDETELYYSWLELASMAGQSPQRPPGVYRHVIGSGIEEDELIYARPWRGMYMALATPSEDGESLYVYDSNLMGSRGAWGVRTAKGGPEAPLRWLTGSAPDHRFAYLGEAEGELYLITDFESPNWRIVATGANRPGLYALREVVAERDEPISMSAGSNAGHVALHDGRLYVTYIQHTSHVIRIFDLEGNAQGEIELPFFGSVTSIEANRDDPVLFIGLQSFFVPHRIHAYDTNAGSLTPMSAGDGSADAFVDYEVDRVFYDSKDGTRIPMSILRRADSERNGRNKVLLYGYGGWGIPNLPSFQNRIHAWLAKGGVYAIANLRGGGEYGISWHEAGKFDHKQDVFDDFAAAGEFLVTEGYTTPSRIAILGASNGGLLTAASYNQRPELFGAVISEVAAIDLLRLPETPVGATQTMELGAPSTSEEMFEYLLGYSPLHNLREEGPFPPILHVVGENDPRCKPGHIYKYVADMQRWPASERLAILRVVRGAGHGSQRKEDNVAWYADELAFAWEMTE